MHIHTHTNMHTYTHAYIHTHCTHTHSHMHKKCVYMRTHIYTHTRTHTHIYMHTCTCTYLHAHMHAHSHLSVLFDYHKIFGVQPHLFAQQLDHIIKAAGRKPISVAFSQNGGPGTPGDWVDKLLGALEGLLTEVYSVLCSHLILMDVTTTAGVESLTGWIQ